MLNNILQREKFTDSRLKLGDVRDGEDAELELETPDGLLQVRDVPDLHAVADRADDGGRAVERDGDGEVHHLPGLDVHAGADDEFRVLLQERFRDCHGVPFAFRACMCHAAL